MSLSSSRPNPVRRSWPRCSTLASAANCQGRRRLTRASASGGFHLAHDRKLMTPAPSGAILDMW